jgi:hypothetical protein
MKSKQLAILLAITAVLGGTVWVLQKGGNDSWKATPASSGGKVLEFDINAVASLAIQSPSGTTTVSRKGEAWVVEDRADYPANFERVGNLLRSLWDLKVVQDVKVGSSQLVRFDLLEPGQGKGTRLDFKDKDGKPLASVLLGKRYMKKSEGPLAEMGEIPAGRYVMPLGSGRVSLVSEALEDAEAKPEAWLKRDFIHVENVASVTLKGATPEQNWKLVRESTAGDWKFEGAQNSEKVDPSKASPLSGALSSPSFADVLAPGAAPEETGFDKATVLTLETFDGFLYTLKLGKVTGENQAVAVEVSAKLEKERSPGKDEKPEDKTKLDEEFKSKLKRLEDKLAAEKTLEGRPFLISSGTFSQFLKDRAQFLAEQKAEATTAPVASPAPAKAAPKAAPAVPAAAAAAGAGGGSPAAAKPAPAKPAAAVVKPAVQAAPAATPAAASPAKP